MFIVKLLLAVLLVVGSVGQGALGLAAEPQSTIDSFVIEGQPLGYWVGQATAPGGPEDVPETVRALTLALGQEDPAVKVAAADAVAALGAKAQAALPALLDQFSHEFPWVRVSCQAAVGSMGKAAVPALIETFKNNTGGPRVRAAFVLGGIGPAAQAAVPVILEAMQDESPVTRARFADVLRQIDPDRFDRTVSTGTGSDTPLELDELSPAIAVEMGDWPQFHGPARDSICREQNLLSTWPEGGPELLWVLDGLGRGYSSISIADGTIYTMGDRPEGSEEAQLVIAYDLHDRQEKWATRIGPPHSDGGPRCTPTVDGDRVYALGTDGDLVCLDVEHGQVVWRKNLVEDFGGKFMSVWKFSESPLVDGQRLICTPGGPQAMMVALNKHTGQVVWQCAIPDLGTKGADGAGYSSAVVAEIDGVRQYVQMIGRGVIGVEADSGRFLWGYNRVANNVANITAPAVRGNCVFASTAYNTGSALLRITRSGDKFQADEVYFIHPRDFQNHHGGFVIVGDYVYGGHGPNRGDPACVNLATGEVVWKERAAARGSAAVVYADNHLIFRYDRGEVLLVEATPDRLRIKGKFEAVQGDGPAWAHPVIYQGKLYLRHANLLACYDLRAVAGE